MPEVPCSSLYQIDRDNNLGFTGQTCKLYFHNSAQISSRTKSLEQPSKLLEVPTN